jgi:hypothetical protein
MARFAIVDAKTNEVTNCVVWNGDRWMSIPGTWVVQTDLVNIGDIYDPKTNTFTRPEQPQE